MAIGLGLSRCKDAVADLTTALREHRTEPLAGYACVGLSLLAAKGLGAEGAIEEIREFMKAVAHRPRAFLQAALGLAAFGDPQVANDLNQIVRDRERTTTERTSAIVALGSVGDRRSIQPLLRVLTNPGEPDRCRVPAARALGRLCDDDSLSWRQQIDPSVLDALTRETLQPYLFRY